MTRWTGLIVYMQVTINHSWPVTVIKPLSTSIVFVLKNRQIGTVFIHVKYLDCPLPQCFSLEQNLMKNHKQNTSFVLYNYLNLYFCPQRPCFLSDQEERRNNCRKHCKNHLYQCINHLNLQLLRRKFVKFHAIRNKNCDNGGHAMFFARTRLNEKSLQRTSQIMMY